MTTTIQKWGNSLAVRIPKTITKKMRIREGTEVQLKTNQRRIVIEQIPQSKETLRGLVAQIAPRTRHKEIDWGQSVGKEIW